jgi:SAM-dependent methyltransferase
VTEQPQTWHYGLIARYWAEFNDDFRPYEIPYFRKFIEDDGQPALDVACGTGRLLLPYLRAGLDVDGCDVSADMIAACREKAEHEGIKPNLHVQPMHQLELPRRYQTLSSAARSGSGARASRTSRRFNASATISNRAERCSTPRFRTRTRGFGGTG